jgi:hypothetical protein
MTNKLYDSKGQLIGYIRTVKKNQHDDLMKVILSTGHELVFGPCDLTSDRDGNWRIRSGALYPRCVGNKTASATNTAAIKDVIFAPPATIVYWSDGSKTVVKCSEKDVFDPEKGLAMAIAKRCGGNKGNYYKEIQNWVEKRGKKYPGKTATQKKAAPKSNPDRESMKKLISKTNEDWNEFLKACANNDNTELLLNMNALTADLKILEIEINK